MRGNAEVIAQLNQALKEELTAINQYFLHAEMCHNWGYHRLGAYIKKQSIDEMKHAEKLIERLLFLDATPQMNYMDLNVGGNVKAQLEGDLKLEENAVAMYNAAIKVSRDAGETWTPCAGPQGGPQEASENVRKDRRHQRANLRCRRVLRLGKLWRLS